MLASRYSSVDGTHEYQLLFEFLHLRHEFGQSINDFLARMQFLWNQIYVSNPIWKDPSDAEMYVRRRNQHRLHQFLMALRDDLNLFVCNCYVVLLFPPWTLPSLNLSVPITDLLIF